MTSQHCAYVVASAAPPVLNITEFLSGLNRQGWSVCLIATPTASTWIDTNAVRAATGCLTRVYPRLPQQQDSLPRADAVIAAPLTFNSLNRWAAGIGDTLAGAVLNEMLGTTVPIVAAPCIKPTLRTHPAYSDSLQRLQAMGVAILDTDPVTHRAENGLAAFDWPAILTQLHTLT